MSPGGLRYCYNFFFFQAEDGIRDLTVTEFRRVLFRSDAGCPRPAAPGPARPARGTGRPPRRPAPTRPVPRSEEHTSELQSQSNFVCRLLLEKKKNNSFYRTTMVRRW